MWSLENSEINWDFPGGSDSKASAYNAGDPGSISGSKEMATHSSTSKLQSMGLQRVGHEKWELPKKKKISLNF